MKSIKISCFVLSFVFVFAGAAMAITFDNVDIGDVNSEALHNLVSWGPIVPGGNGGNYGGIDHCRAIWSSSDNSTNATIDMNFGDGTQRLYFRHLEGIADDGFELYVNGVWKYTHVENTQIEQWVINYVDPPFAPGVWTVEIIATGIAWDSWSTYGQVCFDQIWVGTESPVAVEMDSWGGVKALFR